MTNAIVRVRWIRVVVAAVLAEAVLMAIAIPVTLWVEPDTSFLYIIPAACFLATLFFGRWAAKKAGSATRCSCDPHSNSREVTSPCHAAEARDRHGAISDNRGGGMSRSAGSEEGICSAPALPVRVRVR